VGHIQDTFCCPCLMFLNICILCVVLIRKRAESRFLVTDNAKLTSSILSLNVKKKRLGKRKNKSHIRLNENFFRYHSHTAHYLRQDIIFPSCLPLMSATWTSEDTSLIRKTKIIAQEFCHISMYTSYKDGPYNLSLFFVLILSI